MKFVYCITDSYIDAFIDESDPYSFEMKCYKSVESGLLNLAGTNSSDILGFIIALYDKVENKKELINLINQINCISEGAPVVTYFSDDNLINEIEDELEKSNIHLYNVQYTEIFTDSFIRQNLFGTIIRDMFRPYDSEVVGNDLKRIGPVTERFDPILPKNIMVLTTPIINAPDLVRAIENDSVIKNLEKHGDIISYFLRGEQLNIKYKNINPNRDEIFSKLLGSVQNKSDIVLYRVIFDLIKEGKI